MKTIFLGKISRNKLWERQGLNLGPLGVKRECYPLCYGAPLPPSHTYLCYLEAAGSSPVKGISLSLLNCSFETISIELSQPFNFVLFPWPFSWVTFNYFVLFYFNINGVANQINLDKAKCALAGHHFASCWRHGNSANWPRIPSHSWDKPVNEDKPCQQEKKCPIDRQECLLCSWLYKSLFCSTILLC